MTRNEEIRQEALKWKTDDNEFIAQTAFEAGAKWADEYPKNHWINTHDSLPKAIDILDSSDISKIQWCVCHTNGAYLTYFVGYYAVSIDGEHNVWCDIRGGEEVCDPYEVDYYIPIPELPKGGEQ